MGIFSRRRGPLVGSFSPLGDAVRDKNAMTSSGARVNKRDGDTFRRVLQPWQTRSFTYYDRLGEIKYAAQFYSRALASLELYAGEIVYDEKTGKPEIVPTQNAAAIEQLERIQDPGGGRSTMLASYGRLMFLAGEALLFVSHNQETDQEQWEMLSTDELRTQGGIYTRFAAPSVAAEEFHEASDDDYAPVEDDEAVAYRLWKRHPRYSLLADSTMQGVLDLCEELLLLTMAVRARAKSRLAGSGVLFIADVFSPAPKEAVPDEDAKLDPFLADLTEAMTTPIADEGAASSVVPLVVRGPLEAIKEGVKHVQIIDPMQLYPETGLRRECIERIAIGLDMPPEILLGLQDSNHWTAWQIDEQTWKGHLQPLAQQLVDDLTSAFYRPTLKQANVPDWEKYVIAYDATAIINHPDRGKDAMDLYGARAIGKTALRTAKGFDEDDAMNQDELNEAIGVAVHDGSLALFGEPSVKTGGVETAPGEIVTADTGPPSAPQEDTGASVEKGAPSGGDQSQQQLPETVLGSNGSGDHGAFAWRVIGAADLALARAREVAGNRVRNLAKRDDEAAELIEGIPARQVPAVLGRERVRALGGDPTQLCSGVGDLIQDALRMFGLDPEIIEKLVTMIEKHAARTLFDEHPQPLPSSFVNYAKGISSEIR